MRVVTILARILLGFIFLVFGLNGFFNFIPMPPPTGLAAQFLGALFLSHFLTVILLLELIGGVLLLANRYVPLALALLAPVIFNILGFHVFMAPAGLPLAVLVLILWLISFFAVRSSFAGLFEPQVPKKG
jgi:hypothetical protein